MVHLWPILSMTEPTAAALRNLPSSGRLFMRDLVRLDKAYVPVAALYEPNCRMKGSIACTPLNEELS